MPRNKRKSAKNQITNKGQKATNAMDNVEQPRLTPYQGSDQAFGMFKCQNCNRYWTSNASWANFGQKCNKCKIIVYPFRQFPLDSDSSKRFDKSNPAKHHPKDLCEKCRSLGRYCLRKFKRTRRQNRA